MQDSDGVGIGELSRQVRDVLLRFEGLATRLETQFVRNDNFALYKQLVDNSLDQLQKTVTLLASLERVSNLESKVADKADKATMTGLEDRVVQLEDDKKWITRLVIGFIVLAVLGAIFAVSKAGG